MIAVFVGYDPRQPIAAQVACHSIWARASEPIAIIRLQLLTLPITRRGLTEFTYSRFLVPYLSRFEGWSVFVDADILCRDNLADLLARAQSNPPAAVHVVQGPRRFEWASLMVFDNARCGALTPAYVEDPAHGLFDLAFAEGAVGALPAEWNHLIGYDPPNRRAKLVHFTQGIPIWPETARCEFAEDWLSERDRMTSTVSFAALMGGSVHVGAMNRGAS